MRCILRDHSGRFELTGGNVVTPYNIVCLQELVRNDPTTYPGARYVCEYW
jgi:hypothetical protein